MASGHMAGLVGAIALMTGAALAEAPTSSPRPKARVAIVLPAVLDTSHSFAPLAATLRPRLRPEAATPVAAVASQTASSPRPRARPANLHMAAPAPVQVAMVQPAAVAAPAPKKGLFGFLRPGKRPENLTERQLVSAGAVRILPGKEAVVPKKGSVCGVPEIKGETLAAIPGKLQGCGIDNPVRVTSVAGVRLSTAATINCDTAKALNTWITKGVVPVYGKGQVVELQIFASYACRGRNNKKNAKVSEHGRGNAIDIGGFTLANGQVVSVLHDFNKPMRQVHKAACGIFGTTLGPGSDGYHENHMHFDVARHRNGSYCR